MRVATILLVCVVIMGASSAMAAHRLKSKLAAASLQPARASVGYSCRYLGETQDCATWCTNTCSGPCSVCLNGDGADCACDDIPAISNGNEAIKVGYSCRYLGETQDCATWCSATCSGPCSVCLNGDGAECACDDIPAINDGNGNEDIKKISPAKDDQNIKVGYSCRYLGETQDCATWCTNTCSGPCSVCLNGDGAECACDDIPAINDIKVAPGPGNQNAKVGYSCRYLGETQDCATWCTDTCSGPCSVCLNGDGAECACDDIPAINDIKVAPGPGNQNAKVGYSCRYLGETQDCATWCTNTCSGPCSVCLNGDGAECACDDIPAISNGNEAIKKISPAKDDQNIKVGYSCRYLGETQDCHTWCADNCSGPCSACLNGDGSDCACDDIPAVNN